MVNNQSLAFEHPHLSFNDHHGQQVFQEIFIIIIIIIIIIINYNSFEQC